MGAGHVPAGGGRFSAARRLVPAIERIDWTGV
jgi:hypothetical protein